MKTVAAFRGKCERCRLSFPVPWLSDLAYGSFVFTRSDGKSFRISEAVGHPVWAFVGGLVPPEQAAEVVARVADREEALAFTAHPVCPRCTWPLIQVDDSVRFSELILPDATFSSFEALSPAERTRLVESVFRSVGADGP